MHHRIFAGRLNMLCIRALYASDARETKILGIRRNRWKISTEYFHTPNRNTAGTRMFLSYDPSDARTSREMLL